MTPTPQFNEAVLFAIEQAKAAGKIHLKYWRSTDMTAVIKNNNPRDVVTQADRDAEELITKAILERFPNHAVLGEENGVTGAESSDTIWIVDPLDGTSNFALGDPEFAVLIAQEVGGEVVLGVTYFPARDEMFVVQKGLGAFKNGERLRGVRTEADINNMYGNTQMTSKAEARIKNMSVYTRLIDPGIKPAVRNMHVFNACLARGLCDVADSSSDFHVRSGYNHWDYAAGKLLVEEADGIATDMQGKPLNQSSQSALIASRAAHAPLLQLLQTIK